MTRFIIAILLAWFSLPARSVDWSWDLALTRYASARQIAVQSDGKLVIAGDFEFVGRTRKAGLARLNEDGSLDPQYNPSLAGEILGIAPLGDSLLVATRKESGILLRRYDRDGSRDTGFASEVSSAGFLPSETNPYSFPAKQLPSGKILMIGGARRSTGASQSGLVQLNPDGTLDETFYPDDLPQAAEFSVEVSGSILVISRRGFDTSLVRLDGKTGLLMQSFPIHFLRDVFALPSEKFLLLGDFAEGRKIQRFLSDGTVDETCPVTTSQDLWRSPLRLRDGRFVWLGSPTLLLSSEGDLVAEWPNADDFNPNYGAIAETPSGKIVYSAYPARGPGPGLSHHGINRRTREGVLDPSFRVTGGLMRRTIPHGFPDDQFKLQFGLANSLYLLGPFEFLNGTNTGRFVRLSAERAIDWTFVSNITARSSVPDHFTVENTPDQTLLAGSRVRLSATGEIIETFPPLNDCIASIDSLPLLNGASIHNYRFGGPCTINVGGAFSSYRDRDGRNVIDFDLKQDGLFPGFSISIASAVPASASGDFLIGGTFTSVNGVAATNVARITASGDVDTAFHLSDYVRAPAFLLQRGEEFTGVVEETTTLLRSYYRFDQQGRVLLRKDFAEPIIAVQQALLTPAGELIILSRGYEPNLLVSVFGLDGALVRQVRIPYTFSDFQRLSAALTSEGDLLFTGSYFGDGADAWTGVARLSAAELVPLRLDVIRSGPTIVLSLRARASVSVALYRSSDLKSWRKDRDVSIPSEEKVLISLETGPGAEFFAARIE